MKLKQLFLIIFIVLVIIFLLIFIYNNFIKQKNTKSEFGADQSSTIVNYNYVVKHLIGVTFITNTNGTNTYSPFRPFSYSPISNDINYGNIVQSIIPRFNPEYVLKEMPNLSWAPGSYKTSPSGKIAPDRNWVTIPTTYATSFRLIITPEQEKFFKLHNGVLNNYITTVIVDTNNYNLYQTDIIEKISFITGRKKILIDTLTTIAQLKTAEYYCSELKDTTNVLLNLFTKSRDYIRTNSSNEINTFLGNPTYKAKLDSTRWNCEQVLISTITDITDKLIAEPNASIKLETPFINVPSDMPSCARIISCIPLSINVRNSIINNATRIVKDEDLEYMGIPWYLKKENFGAVNAPANQSYIEEVIAGLKSLSINEAIKRSVIAKISSMTVLPLTTQYTTDLGKLGFYLNDTYADYLKFCVLEDPVRGKGFTEFTLRDPVSGKKIAIMDSNNNQLGIAFTSVKNEKTKQIKYTVSSEFDMLCEKKVFEPILKEIVSKLKAPGSSEYLFKNMSDDLIKSLNNTLFVMAKQEVVIQSGHSRSVSGIDIFIRNIDADKLGTAQRLYEAEASVTKGRGGNLPPIDLPSVRNLQQQSQSTVNQLFIKSDSMTNSGASGSGSSGASGSGVGSSGAPTRGIITGTKVHPEPITIPNAPIQRSGSLNKPNPLYEPPPKPVTGTDNAANAPGVIKQLTGWVNRVYPESPPVTPREINLVEFNGNPLFNQEETLAQNNTELSRANRRPADIADGVPPSIERQLPDTMDTILSLLVRNANQRMAKYITSPIVLASLKAGAVAFRALKFLSYIVFNPVLDVVTLPITLFEIQEAILKKWFDAEPLPDINPFFHLINNSSTTMVLIPFKADVTSADGGVLTYRIETDISKYIYLKPYHIFQERIMISPATYAGYITVGKELRIMGGYSMAIEIGDKIYDGFTFKFLNLMLGKREVTKECPGKVDKGYGVWPDTCMGGTVRWYYVVKNGWGKYGGDWGNYPISGFPETGREIILNRCYYLYENTGLNIKDFGTSNGLRIYTIDLIDVKNNYYEPLNLDNSVLASGMLSLPLQQNYEGWVVEDSSDIKKPIVLPTYYVSIPLRDSGPLMLKDISYVLIQEATMKNSKYPQLSPPKLDILGRMSQAIDMNLYQGTNITLILADVSKIDMTTASLLDPVTGLNTTLLDYTKPFVNFTFEDNTTNNLGINNTTVNLNKPYTSTMQNNTELVFKETDFYGNFIDNTSILTNNYSSDNIPKESFGANEISPYFYDIDVYAPYTLAPSWTSALDNGSVCVVINASDTRYNTQQLTNGDYIFVVRESGLQIKNVITNKITWVGSYNSGVKPLTNWVGAFPYDDPISAVWDLKIQSDGNLCLYDTRNSNFLIWSSKSAQANPSGYYGLFLRDNGWLFIADLTKKCKFNNGPEIIWTNVLGASLTETNWWLGPDAVPIAPPPPPNPNDNVHTYVKKYYQSGSNGYGMLTNSITYGRKLEYKQYDGPSLINGEYRLVTDITGIYVCKDMDRYYSFGTPPTVLWSATYKTSSTFGVPQSAYLNYDFEIQQNGNFRAIYSKYNFVLWESGSVQNFNSNNYEVYLFNNPLGIFGVVDLSTKDSTGKYIIIWTNKLPTGVTDKQTLWSTEVAPFGPPPPPAPPGGAPAPPKEYTSEQDSFWYGTIPTFLGFTFRNYDGPQLRNNDYRLIVSFNGLFVYKGMNAYYQYGTPNPTILWSTTYTTYPTRSVPSQFTLIIQAGGLLSVYDTKNQPNFGNYTKLWESNNVVTEPYSTLGYSVYLFNHPLGIFGIIDLSRKDINNKNIIIWVNQRPTGVTDLQTLWANEQLP